MKTALVLCMTLAFAVAGASYADTCKIVEDVKASVKSGWKKLEKYSDKIAELREARKELPDSTS